MIFIRRNKKSSSEIAESKKNFKFFLDDKQKKIKKVFALFVKCHKLKGWLFEIVGFLACLPVVVTEAFKQKPFLM